jgi:16S rRNA (cytosine967-C5)-methyltransferase
MDKSRPSPDKAGFAARQVAATLLSAVLDQRQPLDSLIDAADSGSAFNRLPERDQRLARAIVATALRHRGEIDAALDKLIARRPRRAGALFRILEIAAAQILFMEVADHAAVSTAMDQIGGDRDGRHFKGLANAVLRRLARERETVLEGTDRARLDTPEWLWARWTKAYGEETTRRIVEAHRVEPSLDLSVRSDPAGWAEKLGGIVLATGTVRLVLSGPVSALPGYADGEWWVQDAAAALPARLLGDVSSKRIADLCAAPGGKTAQLAAAGAEVTAVDISVERLKRLAQNLARLDLPANVVEADILTWNPPDPFDAILLDAPCSATGTIRRHPDAAWLKRPEDVATLAALQARMIDRAVDWLKPGGTLVYCTCSLEKEEGEDQLARAIDRHRLQMLPVAPAEVGGVVELVAPGGALRTLPCHLPGPTPRLSGLDGFFIARLRKS